MIDRDHIEKLHDELRTLKMKSWHDHGQRDMAPRVGIILDNGDSTELGGSLTNPTAPPVQIILGALRPMLASVLRGQPDVKLELIALGVDAYTRTAKTMEEALATDLSSDFMTNPASDVTECLITTVAASDRVGGCDVQTVKQPYSIGDGGVIQWGELNHIDDDSDSGAVSKLLQAFFKEEA